MSRLQSAVDEALTTATRGGYEHMVDWTPIEIANDLRTYCPDAEVVRASADSLARAVRDWLKRNRK